jgi:hypothetical protein
MHFVQAELVKEVRVLAVIGTVTSRKPSQQRAVYALKIALCVITGSNTKIVVRAKE